MDFQIIMLSQYFNVICTFKTSLFTCENDPRNSLNFSRLVGESHNGKYFKKSYRSKKSISIFETVPQREK